LPVNPVHPEQVFEMERKIGYWDSVPLTVCRQYSQFKKMDITWKNPLNRKHHNSAMSFGASLAAAEAWWGRLPAHERKPAYRPRELCRDARVAALHLPTALSLLGWHRARHWSRQDGRRVFRVWYAPPGRRIASPARGRPPINLFDLFGGRAP
jgi:hypothetical protein